MRIAIDVTSGVKPQPTGIGNYVTDLVGTLLKMDRNNHYSLGVRVKRFLRRHYLGNLGEGRAPMLPLIPGFYSSLLGRIDVFHALGVRLPRLGNFCKVATIHDLNTIETPELTRPDWAASRAQRIADTLSRANGVITPSEFTRERIIARFPFYPAEKIRTIHHGVDHERYRPRPAEEIKGVLQKFELDRPYVLHAGAYVPRKNKLNLLRAFAGSKAQKQGGQLVFAGAKRGNFSEIEAEGKKLQLDDSIRYLGYVGRDEIAALIAGAKIFAFPSFYEGFGLPVAEAMAIGTPVITARASCLPEIGGDAVEYFDPHSVEEIRICLEQLWQDESRLQELASRGKERGKLFTWERTAKQTLTFYQELRTS